VGKDRGVKGSLLVSEVEREGKKKAEALTFGERKKKGGWWF